MGNITNQTLRVTKEIAAEWRLTKHFPYQRNISDYNVKRLGAEMENSRFTPGTQVYIAVLPDGQEYILNSNHTLEAIIETGIPQVMTITRNHIADMEEAGLIYAVFDDQMRRKLKDALRATGEDVDEAHLTYTGPAISVIINHFLQLDTWKPVPKPAIMSLLPAYKEAVEAYFEVTANCPRDTRQFTRRASIMALGLETMKHQPARASEFWHNFSHDDGLVAGMPEHSLLRYLRNNPQTTGPARSTTVRASALAWNAAYKRSGLQQVKPEAFKNFIILGTPWEKGLAA